MLHYIKQNWVGVLFLASLIISMSTSCNQVCCSIVLCIYASADFTFDYGNQYRVIHLSTIAGYCFPVSVVSNLICLISAFQLFCVFPSLNLSKPIVYFKCFIIILPAQLYFLLLFFINVLYFFIVYFSFALDKFPILLYFCICFMTILNNVLWSEFHLALIMYIHSLFIILTTGLITCISF